MQEDKLSAVDHLPSAITGKAMVIYTDGSTRPKNPGFIGFGLHGYSYLLENNNKVKANNPQQMQTAEGYYDAKHYKELNNKPPLVEIKSYIDVVSSSAKVATNNTAEVAALKCALEIFHLSECTELLVKSDSEYVVRGFNEWLGIWVKNQWIKRDGRPVPNKEYWTVILELIHALSLNNKQVKVIWVKGHTDSLEDYFNVYGNIVADKLACIASAKSAKLINETIIKVSDPEDYWKVVEKKNPLFNHNHAYITEQSFKLKNVYWIGKHGKDDDFLGRRDADAAFAVVITKQADPYLDLLKKYIHDNAKETMRISMVRLDALYQKNRVRDISQYELDALINTGRGLSLQSADKEPILRELYPPRLGFRVILQLDNLYQLLTDHINGSLKDNHSVTYNDITEIFYKTSYKKTSKGEVKNTTLKPEWKVGASKCEVSLNHKKGKSQVTLGLDFDLPDRNTLKRIESSSPSIFTITVMESEQCFRHYTIVQTDHQEYGIWASVYANQVFIV